MTANTLKTLADQPADPAVSLLFAALPQLSSGSDLEALQDLSVAYRFVGRDTKILRAGERVQKLHLVCSGWAKRSIGLADGRRQIVGFLLPGNLMGLLTDARSTSTFDVVALTRCEVAEFDIAEFNDLICSSPQFSQSLRSQLAFESAMLGDNMLRLGRMTAYERVCHFLMEMFDRQMPGLDSAGTVDFPITQAIVADALGLSVVHVNRQIMRLKNEGLVSLDRRRLTITDANALRRTCGYISRLEGRVTD